VPEGYLVSAPPFLSRAVRHKAKRTVIVGSSLPILGPRDQRQRYASVLQRPTDIHSLLNSPHPSSSTSSRFFVCVSSPSRPRREATVD
jgi:hypothetical protein